MYYEDEEKPPLSASAQLDLEKWISDRRENYDDNIEDEAHPPIDYNQPPTIVSRDEWGAVPPYSTQPLNHPVKYIRFTYTGTLQCRQREDCDAMVRKLQQDAIQQRKIPDIDYNFLVGGDEALIYEGRSWFVDATRPKKLQYLRKNCIDIAFIGNYKPNNYPRIFELASLGLVNYGQLKRYVSEKLDIIGMDDQIVIQPATPEP